MENEKLAIVVHGVNTRSKEDFARRGRSAVPIEVGLDNQRIAAAHKLQRLALRWPIRDRV
jgi:hypothetical protein